ncbi:DUF1624 domain-containing protein [Pseudoflavitalea sp. G-6-1-2]|uniref:DUF1624 domain-containing protein n=1 Tax=Pseudoflavitalea sp. G-6-1-2 TaxID=2728841 RepID=UPI00146EC536|nr:heparan-alpha-glucosaminide N-acetyltransferase domain-containing protein [Pseudoflavitalea sp. G-6-1-2]NML19871.1 DUF1624 domain-containing protein [Pseudoflavitalea sp. G-6-1-2]
MQPITQSRSRIASIDILRGIIMVIMALDHVRDYFTIARFDPTDLSQTTPAMFFTRWITHICAPTFMFLAGTGSFLYGAKRTKPELSRFLFTRGLFLVILEFTLVTLALQFNFSFNLLIALVFWSIGMSMIFLAAMIWLPNKILLAVSLLMILLHNTTDNISPESFGSFSWLWNVLHVRGFIPFSETSGLVIGYPLIPWIGVIGAGYAFGQCFLWEPKKRSRFFVQLGLTLIGLFILVRGLNVYGDPMPWTTQKSSLYTLLSFLDTAKYPPSLSFLLMTIGPAILLLGLLENAKGSFANFFSVYGKVPLFYFLLHFYLIHLISIFAGMAQGFKATDFLHISDSYPKEYGFGLPGVYLFWALIVLLLYYPCKWYGNLKARSKNPLLSYI